MKLPIFIIGLTLCFTTVIQAQSKLSYTASGDAIIKGDKAHKKEKYSSALKYYHKVHAGDTNYHRSLYEIAKTYFAQEEYQWVVDLASQEVLEQNEMTPNFYNLLGQAYEELEDADLAIATYSKGITLYPANHLLYYNRSLTYARLENWDAYVRDLKSTLKRNPYHATTHYKLGELAKEEGQVTKAMLCFNTYLLLKASNNLEFLSEYNDYLNEQYDPDPKDITLSNEDYSDIDEMISSIAALNKKYKTPNKLRLALVKQNHLLFAQLQQRELGTGFWDVFYVPFYVQLVNEGKFNDYMYFVLQSSTTPSIVKVLNKNLKAIKAFPSYAGTAWQVKHSDYTEDYQGELQTVHYYWDSPTAAEARGVVIDHEPVGRFEYYRNSGQISAIGNYTTDGERTGVWTYYHINRVIRGLESYQEGNLVGMDSSFYDNGQVKSATPLASGKSHGLEMNFKRNGLMKSRALYSEGELNGSTIYYNRVGLLDYDVQYKDGKLSGPYRSYFDNGQIAEEVGFENGKRSGSSTKYYKNGQKSGTFIYVDGLLHGQVTRWYDDGTLKSQEEYKEGISINILTQYNANGSISSVQTYDETGKKNGDYKSYDQEGNLNMVLFYKKGDLISYQIFHREGHLIKEAKKKSGAFLFENFYSDGTRKTEGVYEPGEIGKSGVWKHYDQNGALQSESNYSKGQLNGKTTNYYANGNKKNVTTYKDGDANGFYVKYYEHNQVKQQGYYINDQLEGKWLSYAPDGTLASEKFYTQGNRNGPQKYYTVHGKLDFIDTYTNNLHMQFEFFDTNEVSIQKVKLTGDSILNSPLYPGGEKLRDFTTKGMISHGPSTNYYPQGGISSKGLYWNGNKHGLWTTYFETGNVNARGHYFYGNKTGDWTYNHEDGKIILTESYKNGSRHGLRTWYHNNGTKDSERTYENGLENGLAYFYDGNGSLQHIRQYFYGKITGYAYLGTDGEPVAMIPIENETCECKSYFENGKISREFSMDHGNFNGEYLEYYENGQLFSKVTYVNNIQQGMETIYYDNGKIKREIPKVNDQTHGVEKHYNADGSLRQTKTYVTDTQHGLTHWYKNGLVIKSALYYDGAFYSK